MTFGFVIMARPFVVRPSSVKWVAIDRKSFELEVVGAGDGWLHVTEFGKGRRFSIFFSREAARWWLKEWRMFAGSERFFSWRMRLREGKNGSVGVGWSFVWVVIMGLATAVVGGYVVYKYRIRRYKDSEIRASWLSTCLSIIKSISLLMLPIKISETTPQVMYKDGPEEVFQ